MPNSHLGDRNLVRTAAVMSDIPTGIPRSPEWDAALVHSKVGDKVRFCLISIPKDCPPGDDRGRVYETTNLRTNGVWKMPDDPHMCGGA
jgi:hypothetical protein